jgi:hypothetical protein
MQDKVVEAAQARAMQGELACEDAHALAGELGLSPIELGQAVSTRSQLRFNRCQLGLFGYGSKAAGEHKIVLKAARVPPAVAEAVSARVVNGHIPCAAVWEVAAEFRYPRLGVANIVEALGLKVAPCQLGCF